MPVPLARKLALRPVGKKAPPRPRRPESRISWTTAPAPSRAPSRAPRSRPPRGSRRASRSALLGARRGRRTAQPPRAQLLDDRRHVRGGDRLAVAVVDRDDGAPAAAARALDRPQRHLAVLGRLAGADAELVLERLEHLLRADERAGDVRADLDEVPSRPARGGTCRRRTRPPCSTRASPRAPRRPRGTPPARASRAAPARAGAPGSVAERETGSARGAPGSRRRASRGGGAHRSTSPMTASSEPTIAIRSATATSWHAGRGRVQRGERRARGT